MSGNDNPNDYFSPARRAERKAARKAARETKRLRREQEEAEARERRRNFPYDDTVRIWREDARDYLTDAEYVEWYEGYYYDPDNPY